MPRQRLLLLTIVLLTNLATAPLLAQSTPALEEQIDTPAPARYITPSLTFYTGFSRRLMHAPDAATRKGFHLNIHLGATLHQRRSERSTQFLGLGAELEPRQADNGKRLLAIMPMATLGMTRTDCHTTQGWVSAAFPCLSLYALAGVRPGHERDAWAARLGIGAMGLPGHKFELLMERDLGQNTLIMWRFGFGF